MTRQITLVSISKWSKVVNLFAQKLQWHQQPYHYCTHIITLILYDIICKITCCGKCKCRHRKLYEFFAVWILHKSITNVELNQLVVFVVKIRGMDRYITEIIVLANKVYAHMAYLCHVYLHLDNKLEECL